MAFTLDTLNKIKKIIKDNKSHPDSVEYRHAMRYLKFLLKATPANPTYKQLNTLESQLVRLFRIRPSQYNKQPSAVTEIYQLLNNEKLFRASVTAEETLTAEVLTFILNAQSMLPHAISGDDEEQVVTPIDDGEELKTLNTNIQPTIAASNSLYQKAADPDTSLTLLKDDAINFDWNKTDWAGHTLLHNAAKANETTLCKQLLAVGANPNAQSSNSKSTPLIYAIEDSHSTVVAALCEAKNTDVNLSTRMGKTPLTIALENKYYSGIKILANHPHIEFGIRSAEIAKQALEHKWPAALATLATQAPSVLPKNLLITAARNGWPNVVQAVIEATPAKDQVTAVNSTHMETPEIDWRPLHYAAYHGRPEVVDILLKYGANPETQTNSKRSALSIMCTQAAPEKKDLYISIAEKLLTKMDAASVNAKDADNLTALEYAIQAKHGGVVALLVKFEGITLPANILHAAAGNGWLEVIKEVIEATPNDQRIALVNTADAGGCTPLHFAAEQGFESVVDMLLKHGANPDTVNLEKNTALTLVTGRSKKGRKDSHLSIAEKLLKKMNLDSINAKTENNHTSLEWAVQATNEAMIALLVKVEGINLPDDIAEVAQENNWTSVTTALEVKGISAVPEDNKRIQTLENKVAALEKLVLEQGKQIALLLANTNTATKEAYFPSVDTSSSSNNQRTSKLIDPSDKGNQPGGQ